MKRDEVLFLDDILENIDDIETFSKGLTKEELFANTLKLKAIERCLEIIGEAVKNVSLKTKDQYPEVEWKKIGGTRDIFIHAYFKIDGDIVWRVIKERLPILKKQIQQIKNEGEDESISTAP